MLNTKYTRTTISVPEELLFEIKKKALLERKTVTEVINKSLSVYLGKEFPPKTSLNINSLFGAWGKGPSGLTSLKKIRYGKANKEREKYISKLWKKS